MVWLIEIEVEWKDGSTYLRSLNKKKKHKKITDQKKKSYRPFQFEIYSIMFLYTCEHVSKFQTPAAIGYSLEYI